MVSHTILLKLAHTLQEIRWKYKLINIIFAAMSKLQTRKFMSILKPDELSWWKNQSAEYWD